MKKLSRIELDVVVNEVINNLKKIEEKKVNKLFEISDNKDLFLEKVNEIKELEDKVNLLKEEIREIENKFKEEGISVYFNRGFNNNGKLFNISLKDSKGNSFELYKNIEKEIILSSLEELNVRDLIKDLVEKFK
jgi:fructose-1,6-bisphosphatase/sedoheptulose 1,7-bisphosphatase-like protein